MKVAILALPRTGGDNFGKWLSTELNYKFIKEPIHKLNQRKKHIKFVDDVVVKYTFDEFKYDINEAYNELKKFDYVITHYRKNTYEQAKSWVYYELNIANTKNENSYIVYEDWEDKYKKDIQQIQNEIESYLIDIKSVTSDVLMSYEELYYGDGYKKIEALFGFTSQHLDIIHPKNRYFKGVKPSKKNKTLL